MRTSAPPVRAVPTAYSPAAVADGSQGQGIAVDLARPAVYRVGFSLDACELYAAFDIALTPERPEAAGCRAAVWFRWPGRFPSGIGEVLC